MLGIERTFEVSRRTLSAWLKEQANGFPPLEERLQPVECKKIPVWMWMSCAPLSWGIVASACGDRTENTCRILWGRAPSAYKEAIVFSDYWSAYQAVIPSGQQRPVGKETEETVHIERWNNTLRKQLERFLRKTLSFSKCVKMHEICLKLFIHRYNTGLLPIVG